MFIFSFANYLLVSNHKFRNHLLLLAIFIGTFAKDVTMFILLAFVLFNYFDYKKQKNNSKIFWSVGAVLCFLIPYLILRFTFGFFPYESTIMHNIYAFKAILIFLIFIGIPAFLALYDFKSKPLSIKILTFIFSLYTLLLLFVGNIDETRIFIPVLLILIPQVMMNLKKEFS